MRRNTILVVENDDNDVILLTAMFKRSKILNDVQIVKTVADAICYLKGEGVYADREAYPFPILVILDLHLADGSGFEVLDWIHQHAKAAAPAVIVLTASDVNAIQQAYSRGADSFLVKPMSFEDFENTIHRVRGVRMVATGEGYEVQLG